MPVERWGILQDEHPRQQLCTLAYIVRLTRCLVFGAGLTESLLRCPCRRRCRCHDPRDEPWECRMLRGPQAAFSCGTIGHKNSADVCFRILSLAKPPDRI